MLTYSQIQLKNQFHCLLEINQRYQWRLFRIQIFSEKIKESDKEVGVLEDKINNSLLYVPNIIHNSVPIGKTEKDNVVVREYGKYFKVELSVLNNSSNRVDFIPENIEVNVNGDVRKKEKYKQLSFEEYKLKAERRQAFQQGLVSGLQGFSEGMAGNTYSTSTSTNWDNGYPHITTTTTQSYSPALANIQRQQNQKNLNEMQEVGIEEMKFISEGYLKNHTIFPNTSLEGYILIPYHRKVTDIDLVVRIGNKEFDFSNVKEHNNIWFSWRELEFK